MISKIKTHIVKISVIATMLTVGIVMMAYTKADNNESSESELISKNICSKDYVITLEIEGEEYSSPEFAEKIRKVLIENSNITFVIGGSYGLADSIKNKANMHLSFSKMTFPHQLFRVILLEQIYRAYKINNNESYHK